MQYSAGFAIRALMVLVAMCFATHAQAQNQVINPDFNAVLLPWAQFLSSAPDPVGAGAAPVRVASPDFNGSLLSGSALVDINATVAAPDAASGITECVSFTPILVSFVNYGGSFLLPATTIADSAINATVEVRLFSAAGCSGFITGGSQGRTFLPGLATATWFTATDNNFVLPGLLPVSVASAEVRGYLRQTGGVAPTQTDYKSNFDRFFLVLNNTTPVRLQEFDVE